MKIQKRLQKRKQKKPLPTIGTELHAAWYHPNFTGRQHTPVISVHSVTGMSRSGPPGRLGSGFALGWAEGLSPLPLSLGPPLAHGLPHGHDHFIIAWLFSILPCFFPLSRAEIDESSGDFDGKMVEGAKNRQQDAPCCRFWVPSEWVGMGLLSPSGPGRRRPCSAPGPWRGRWPPERPARPRQGCWGNNGTGGP